MDVNTLKSVYFIGAGGIGMSALVRYFLSKGKKVGGYDRTPSELTLKLIEEGADIHYEEAPEKIPGEWIYYLQASTGFGNAHPFQQGIMCSRHTWKDHNIYHDCPFVASITSGL